MNNKKLLIYIFISVVLLSLFFIISFNYIKQEEKRLLDNKYELLSTQIIKNINFLIEDKKNATYSFSIALSKSMRLKEFLSDKNYKKLYFKELSEQLKKETKFKNVWFQIVDKKGNSVYRSWSNKKGDSLLFRFDVINMIKKHKNQTTISVGKYDITFKSMIPIFDKDKFVGFFEVITHFNSISKLLKKSNFEVLVLADERFFKKLIFPFNKKFIDKYYVANVDANDNFIKNVKDYGVKNIINIENFSIIDNNFFLNYRIKDNLNNNIGHIILSKKIADIDISEISNFKNNFLLYLIFSIVLFILILSSIFYFFYTNKILLEKKKAQQILDSQKNIIIITDGKILNNANKYFLEFFNTYSSIDEFKKVHTCICDEFINMNDKNYLINKDYDGKNWAEYILANPEKSFKCAMKKDGQIEYFAINANLNKFKGENKPHIIVTFTNITSEIKNKIQIKKTNDNLEFLVAMKTKELKNLNDSLEKKIKEEIEKSKKKDTILFQQNKMAAMGEMINNIAHQWRQPLSAISSATSAIQLKNLVDEIDKNDLNYYCEHIINSSNYLSQTIEDFRNFFKKDKEKQEFFLNEVIEHNKTLLSEKLKIKNIKLIINIDQKTKIYGYKNEFQQAILNILNNSIDALIENKIEDKYILINENNLKLSIKDNANGLEEDILEHIFEPYFTTKHKSQGTGIGLYMVQNILEKNMNFKISAKNEVFTYNNTNYKGLNFIINLNK